MDDDDDLEHLLDVALARRRRRRGEDTVAVVPLPAPIGDVGGAFHAPFAEVAGDDLEALVAIAGDAPTPRFQQRSWELMKHCRAKLKADRLENKLDKGKEKLEKLSNLSADLRSDFPMVAKAMGFPRAWHRIAMTCDRALVLERLASQPSLRGLPWYRKKQAEAMYVICTASPQVQDRCRDRIFLTPRAAAEPVEVAEEPLPAPVHMTSCLCGEWDETAKDYG
jgi:hypothetical protein